MLTPPDEPIEVGRVHRTLADVEMVVYDYDRIASRIEVLPAGSLFQPWEPVHWRGEEVPITLGDRASQFDWGVSAWDGHFLRWDDFFRRCELVATEPFSD